MRTLKLTLDTLTVTFGTVDAKFANYEKVLAESGTLEYSLYGTTIQDGNLYEPKHVWTVSAYLTRGAWQSFTALYQRSERYRRTQANYSIAIEDFIQPYIEDTTTRTRALATGAQTIAIGTEAIAYPAKFLARMFEPKVTEGSNGIYPYLVSFVLKELDKVNA